VALGVVAGAGWACPLLGEEGTGGRGVRGLRYGKRQCSLVRPGGIISPLCRLKVCFVRIKHVH
jgi:hypothetical protein